MIYLVDTSVWSLALRRHSASQSAAQRVLVRQLAELIGEGRVAIVGPVRQELLSGVKSSRHFAQIRDSLRAFPDEPIHARDYETAAELSNACSAKGVASTHVDILLCAVALRLDCTILTTDRDFKNYSRVTHVAARAEAL